MSQQPPAAGGLEHLIEQLRVSDGARSQPQGGPQTHTNAHQYQHPNPPNQHNSQQSFSSPSRPLGQRQPQKQHRQYNEQQYRHGNYRPNSDFQQRQSPRGGQRGISLMDYVRSPSQTNIPNATLSSPRAQPMPRQSFTPRNGQYRQHGRDFSDGRQSFNPAAQVEYLERVAQEEIPKVAISAEEIRDKQDFRARLESICQNVLQQSYPQANARLGFIPYGSMLSGFAVAGSDMDIICSINASLPDLESDVLARLFEGELLNMGIGARALTRTRVPILKICQKPNEQLHGALVAEHEKWLQEKDKPDPVDDDEADGQVQDRDTQEAKGTSVPTTTGEGDDLQANGKDATKSDQVASQSKDDQAISQSETDKQEQKTKQWRRQKISGPLDFPKDGVGFQCDISFRGLLGVHNTQLLRCYSACDPRVRDMVLFIKSWAKRRQINNSYSGTLCSYGWVLLVLHFLVNVARPPVLPNLQLEFGAPDRKHVVDGYNVAFADDEMQLHQMAVQGRITQNQESLGSLLRSFFHYYAHQGGRVIGGGFRWRDDVISIRNRGGIISKASKGWTGASNTMVNNVEVRQRYLLAVECPLEIDHNVARTVHHYGVVAIRDELRRAWNILQAVRSGRPLQEGLFDAVQDSEEEEKDPVDGKHVPKSEQAGILGQAAG